MKLGYEINKYAPRILLEAAAPLYRHLYREPAAFRRYWKWFDATDTWTRETLLDYQWRAMKQLLEHAAEQVPFYREIWRAKQIDVREIESPTDLACLPVLTKTDIREHGADLLALGTDPQRLTEYQTGGSTGTPLTFYYDRATAIARLASMARWEKYAGKRHRGEKQFYMGRPSFELMNDPNRWIDQGERYYGDYFPITRRGFLASSNLSDDVMEKYCDLMVRERPRFLKGYSSALQILAEYCYRKGCDINFLDAVLASSETVTARLRELAQSIWNCEVFDRYGLGEEVVGAAECRMHNGYHNDMVRCYVEVLDGSGNSLDEESGDLVGTCLTNYAMPLIRYQTGDQAALTRRICPCGIESSLLARIDGRSDDLIRTPSGRQVSSGGLGQVGNGIATIREYQLIQRALDEVLVRISWAGDPDPAGERLFMDRLLAQLDPSVTVQLETVAHIEREPNGKFRLVRSELS